MRKIILFFMLLWCPLVWADFESVDITATGILSGVTILEDGNAVYNSSETPGGDLGGTWANPSVDDDSHAHVFSDIDETTSSNWIGRVSDETGTGKWCFATDPTFTTGITVPNNSISAAELNEGDNFTFTGTINFSGAAWEGDSTLSGDLTLQAVGPDLTLDPTSGDSFGFHVEPTISQAWLSNETDSVHYLFFDHNHIMRYGRTGNVPAHIFTTDGTGDGEVVLPDDSIGPDEMAVGAYDLGTSLEADTITEGGIGVYNINEITAAVVEAILVDDAMDFGTGTVSAAGFNLADGEFIGWGGDETITYDGTDFQITDNLDFGTNILTDALVGYVDQSVVSGATPTFTATNITGVPAASILAGTLGTGAYVFDNTITGVTDLTIAGSLLHTGDADTHIAFTSDVITLTYGGTAVTGANITTNNAKVTESTSAGRSLTLSTYEVNADAELYTDTKGIYFEDPTAADDFKSIWFAKQACVITSIWAESDQTVTFMLQKDDGTPADLDTVDLAPAAGTDEDTSLDGDATFAAGDRLDLAVTSVSGTPTWVSIMWTFTYSD